MLEVSFRMLVIGFTFYEALKHCFVPPAINTSNFLIILFDPYFVHILKCVPHVCLEIAGVIPLYWSKRYKLHDLATSRQQLNIMLQPILDHDSYIHIRLVHNSRTDIYISWNISHSQIKFYQYHLVQIWL